MDVGSLVTRLIMDADQFDSTINKSQKEVAAFKAKAENVGREINSVFNGITGTALKLVPAIAAGTTALGAFNKIISNSGPLADSLDKVMLQVGSSIDYVASRAADLNFDDAIDGLKESVRLAGDLADILDEISTIKTYKGYQSAVTEKLREEEKNKLAKWEQDPSEKNRRALEVVRAARIASEAKDLDLLNKHIKEINNEINNEAKRTVNSLELNKKKPLVNGIGYAKEIATSKSALEQGQRWKSGFAKQNYEYPYKSGIDILKSFSFKDVWESTVSDRFEKLFNRITGLEFNEKNYNKVRAYSLLSEKEGVSDDGVSKYITKITELYQQKEVEEKAYYAGLNQSERINKRENKEIHTNNKKVNTKLTNTNETLEEINKKFEDTKTLLSLQNKEGYLDNESYLKELLRTTDSYIAKLYDPLYANAEGIKDLRSAAISTRDGIIKQLSNLNKPQEKFNFSNSNFNLINSNLYRQLEKLITLQLGSKGSEDIAEMSANSRAIYTKIILDNSTNFKDTLSLIKPLLIRLNKVISLDYEKVLAIIMDNDKENKFLGLSSGEELSTIFNRAFSGSRTGKVNDKITSDLVYEFLKFVRIMSALPSNMVNTFKEEWIKLNKNPELFISKGYDSALPLALKSVPDASKYIDTKLSPIKEIQDIREEARKGLGVSRKDLNDYYKQGAPVLDTEDLVEKINAFKSFNNLSNLDFFSNSNLESIDKELQTKLSTFKILMKDLLDGRKELEDELNRGTKIEYNENGKKIGERDLTEVEINDLNSQIEGIDLANKTYKSYLDRLEQSQIATQKLIQISQVFNIKQKEIKEGFDNFRSISGSIGEITSAFSDLDGKAGEFARTLGALNNFANVIANLVEKLKLLSEAENAAKIAADVTGSAINNETAATTTNTAAITANSAATTSSAAANDTSATSTTTDTTATTTNTAATIANTAATTTDTAVSAANTAANVGEAASEGTKQASKLPFPANIGAIAAVLAAIGGAAATISSLSRKKYATGGIVTGPGSSFSDSIPISVSNGEMILNKSQQKNLFDLLNYGEGSSRGGGTSEVNFKILGENLVGSINNRNKGRNKIL